MQKFLKTMHQGLSDYVNASGTNWDTLIPFYLMAYRATSHGSTGFSPYYLLHGRNPTNYKEHHSKVVTRCNRDRPSSQVGKFKVQFEDGLQVGPTEHSQVVPVEQAVL
jgi:hypothetical protein